MNIIELRARVNNRIIVMKPSKQINKSEQQIRIYIYNYIISFHIEYLYTFSYADKKK